MPRATRALAASTIVVLAAAVWLYIDNRALRAELATRNATVTSDDDGSAHAPSIRRDAGSLGSDRR
jgi:hypothetical protein